MSMNINFIGPFLPSKSPFSPFKSPFDFQIVFVVIQIALFAFQIALIVVQVASLDPRCELACEFVPLAVLGLDARFSLLHTAIYLSESE